MILSGQGVNSQPLGKGGAGTAGNGGSGQQEKRLQMGTQSEVHMDPPGGGPATKVNKGARNGDEQIVREWRKSTRTKCVRVVKSKMPKCERPRTSDSRHARSTIRVAKAELAM